MRAQGCEGARAGGHKVQGYEGPMAEGCKDMRGVRVQGHGAGEHKGCEGRRVQRYQKELDSDTNRAR